MHLPARLARLPELAHDLWWTWNPAREVFRRLDYALVAADGAQPGDDAAAAVARRRSSAPPPTRRSSPLYDAAIAAHGRGATPPRRRGARGGTQHGRAAIRTQVIAYFCAEFALHQSLPIYAGGLGVLAGDHCKEASDLGVPLVGVGFMYPQGYFRQRDLAGRLAAGGLRAARLGRRADRARRARVDDKPCVVLVPLGDAQRARPGVGSAARPRAAAPARHRPRAERAVGSRAVGAALRRRPGHAAAAGDRARPRRRARAARARPARRPSGT